MTGIMTGKTNSQVENDRARVVGWTSASAAKLKTAVKVFGSQGAVAALAGIGRQSLVEILAGRSTPTYGTLRSLCSALQISVSEVLDDSVAVSLTEGLRPVPQLNQRVDVVSVPALNITASAGDGSLAVGEHLRPGPFHFASDWLRNSFGSIAALKLVQVKGDSQEPDLHGGDWVMIDDSRTAIENGLAVVRLDDCLMIKWLQREGHLLRLISRNPQYLPTELDLRRDEARLQVIGKAVFVFKAV